MSSRSATRIGLQRLTLADLHAAWLPALDAALLLRAKRSALGRTMLCRQLAAAGYELFRGLLLDRSDAETLQQNPWLAVPLAQADDLLCELGAMALTPALRAVVMRDEVLRLRRVLGELRYREVLVRSVLTRPVPVEALDCSSDETLASQLRRRGAHEIDRYAQSALPAMLAGRVRLALDPAALSDEDAYLSADTVHSCLLSFGRHRARQSPFGVAA